MKCWSVFLGLLLAGFTSVFAATDTNVEVIPFDQKIKKVIITNTSGVTLVKGTSRKNAELRVTKVKVSDICEFRHETQVNILYVGVHNRGFTGAGDCEINLDFEVPTNAQLEITTGSGLTEIADVDGPIQFRSGSGLVKVDSASRKVKGGTGSGSIEFLAKALKSDIELNSGSGSILLKLPKDAKPAVRFESGSGQMANDFAPQKRGRVKVSVRTGSGDLSVQAL